MILRRSLSLWLATTTVLSAATGTTPTTPEALALKIDGADGGYVRQWEGGDRYLDLTLPASGDPRTQAQERIAPLVFTLPPEDLAPWAGLLQDFLGGQSRSHALLTAEYTANRPGATTSYTGVQLAEAVFVVSTSPATIRLSLTANARSACSQPAPRGMLTGTRTLGGSSFQVTVAGSNAGRLVAAVRPIVLRSTTGGARLVEPLELASTAETDFAAWMSDSLAGNPGGRRTVTVTLLDATARNAYVTLTFTDAVLLRLQRINDNRRWLASLVSNQIGVTFAGAAPASSSGASPTPAPTASPSPAPTAATPSHPIAANPTRADKALNAPSSPADQGLRDPAGFPRPDGLTRIRYSHAEYATSATESADYASKQDIDALWQTYRKALSAGGVWKLDNKNDSGTSPDNRMILSNWKQGKNIADLRLYATKDGTNVSLAITTYE